MDEYEGWWVNNVSKSWDEDLMLGIIFGPKEETELSCKYNCLSEICGSGASAPVTEYRVVY